MNGTGGVLRQKIPDFPAKPLAKSFLIAYNSL
jgi:hypothetical protein